MSSFKKVYAGIVKSLQLGIELIIKGNASIIGDNTGDQTDASLPFSDIPTNNASIFKHGFLRKLPNSSAVFLDGQGNWNTPTGTGITSITATAPIYSSGGLTPNITYKPTSDVYVAFSAGGQSGATPLLQQFNAVDTVSAPLASVIMLPATVGVWQTIRNDSLSGNDMNLYPQSGQNFRGYSVDFPLPISPGNEVSFFCFITGEFR